MARKKSKKRRVRRKTRKARSSRRSSRRRSNPGNYRKPAYGPSKKHLAAWAKLGVTRAQDIREGIKAPRGLKMNSAEKVTLAKIRFNEALDSVKMYEKALEKYQSKLDAYKAEMQAWRAAKKAGTEMPKPKRPSKPSGKSRGTPDSGNFLTTTKSQATQYLKRVFRWQPAVKDRYKTKSALKEVAAEAGKRSGSAWIKFAQKGRTQKGILGARLQEALLTVGVPEAAELMRKAQKNALKHAKKLEAKKQAADKAKAKRAKTTKARLEKELKKLEARAKKSAETYNQKQKDLSQKIASLRSARRMARMARAKAKKARRRNPTRARKAKRSMKRRSKRAKKAKRSMKRRSKRAKKAKRSKRAKKAKRSKKRSRRRKR